jgi:hypothetical protein
LTEARTHTRIDTLPVLYSTCSTTGSPAGLRSSRAHAALSPSRTPATSSLLLSLRCSVIARRRIATPVGAEVGIRVSQSRGPAPRRRRDDAADKEGIDVRHKEADLIDLGVLPRAFPGLDRKEMMLVLGVKDAVVVALQEYAKEWVARLQVKRGF